MGEVVMFYKYKVKIKRMDKKLEVYDAHAFNIDTASSPPLISMVLGNETRLLPLLDNIEYMSVVENKHGE